MHDDIKLTGIQTEFSRNSLLVSKTNPSGLIIYANADFCRVAGYTLEEIIGKPHNLIRHPDMPRAVFSLMWDTLKAQKEFFGYVLNRCANGNHYWVFAQVVPDVEHLTGETISYHSTRRWADARSCGRAMEVYRQLLEAEAMERSPRTAVLAGRRALDEVLQRAHLSYEEWVFGLSNS